MQELSKEEIAFLCEVFLEDFSQESGDLAAMYQELVSESEEQWLNFLRICKQRVKK